MKFKIFIFVCFLNMSTAVFAFDASPRCFKELQLHFFQPAIVSQALSIHRVDQSVWTPIVQLLEEASKKVPEIIKKRAQGMNPNPLEPIFIPEVAKALLEEALFDVFSGVLISFNNYQDIRINGNDIRDMFNYIMEKQASRIDGCIILPKKK